MDKRELTQFEEMLVYSRLRNTKANINQMAAAMIDEAYSCADDQLGEVEREAMNIRDAADRLLLAVQAELIRRNGGMV